MMISIPEYPDKMVGEEMSLIGGGTIKLAIGRVIASCITPARSVGAGVGGGGSGRTISGARRSSLGSGTIPIPDDNRDGVVGLRPGGRMDTTNCLVGVGMTEAETALMNVTDGFDVNRRCGITISGFPGGSKARIEPA